MPPDAPDATPENFRLTELDERLKNQEAFRKGREARARAKETPEKK